MELLYFIGMLLAVIDKTICQEPIVGTVSNLTPGRFKSRNDRRVSVVDGTGALGNEIVPPVDGGVPSTEIGILPKEIGISASERRILPGDTGILPGDTGILPGDTGILPADAGISLADRLIIRPDIGSAPTDAGIISGAVIGNLQTGSGTSAVERGIIPTGAGTSAVERGSVPADGRFSSVDVGNSAADFIPVEMGPSGINKIVSLPDGRKSPIDGSSLSSVGGTASPNSRNSSINRTASLPDSWVDGKISMTVSIDGTITLPDGTLAPVDGTFLMPDGTLAPVDMTVSLPDGTLAPVDGTVSLPDARISRVSSPDRTIPSIDRSVVGAGSLPGGISGIVSNPNERLLQINREVLSPERRVGSRLLQEDPMFVDDECRKVGCVYPYLCYIPHPRNCLKFIMCRPLESGEIISQVMSCAFGTQWKPGFEPACERFDLVDCQNDRCKIPTVKAYAHQGNCRTYWTCINRQSRPACCAKYHSFDPITNTCVQDKTCDSACPLLNDASCGVAGVRSANFEDGNCRTYFDCENGFPHPVCCPDGEAFDVFKLTCVIDRSCRHTCPMEYSESCSIPGTISYDLLDDNCRTYIKCNKNGQANRYCCLPGSMYDKRQKMCVAGRGKTCVHAGCPHNYHEECRLEVVPGNPHVYKNLDAFGGMEMPCPVGTIFEETGCQCIPDPRPKPPPLFCTMDIDAIFPDLKNQGSAVAALLMIGQYGQGETGVGNMTTHWNGNAGINIPFYGSQTLNKLYLETRIRPTGDPTIKQVFLTSCSYMAGVPSFEVSLDPSQGRQGRIKVLAKTDSIPGLAEIFLPYNVNDDIVLRVVYDGSNIGAFVDSTDPTMSARDVRPLSGFIPIHRSGLRFAHCRNEQNISGFIGYVSEIKFSKCLTQPMHDVLNAIVTTTV